MIIRNFKIFLLVFLTAATTTKSKTSVFAKKVDGGECKDGGIDRENLEVNIIPIDFRNNHSQNYRQMFMQLSVNETVGKCMNETTYDLKLSLDPPFERDDIKVGSIATEHFITVEKDHLEISSCNANNYQISNDQVDDLLGLFNQGKGTSSEKFREIIFFTSPKELWSINDNIDTIQISFKKGDKKKMCDYRGCLKILTCTFQ